jgi:hypothetical protein
MKSRKDEGMVAIWGAITFLFLVGAVAFAADTSNFFQSARVDQTTADLACLAGAQELPGSSSAALTIASENVKANFPRVATATPVMTSNQATLTLGGNVVVINTSWGGDAKKMRVEVTSSEPRTFSRIWGSSNVPVRQQAICVSLPAAGGPGSMPLYALAGSWNGDLHPCVISSDCGALDSGSGANDLGDAVANGLSGPLEKHHGNWNVADVQSGRVGTKCSVSNTVVASPCNSLQIQDGQHVGKIRSGIRERMSRQVEGYCPDPNFNCDTMGQVIHGTQFPPPVQTLFQALGATQPSWWIPGLYGSYASVMNSQYYYEGDIAKCDSPRLATVPIMNYSGLGNGNNKGIPNNWDIGGPAGAWQQGKHWRKIIGFYTVYIERPMTDAEVDNFLQTRVMWFGQDTTCDGQPVQFAGSPPVSGSVKLVAS